MLFFSHLCEYRLEDPRRKIVGSANWIAFITIAFGAVTIGEGFIHNWGSLGALRAVLGIFEAVGVPKSPLR